MEVKELVRESVREMRKELRVGLLVTGDFFIFFTFICVTIFYMNIDILKE